MKNDSKDRSMKITKRSYRPQHLCKSVEQKDAGETKLNIFTAVKLGLSCIIVVFNASALGLRRI